MSGQEDLDVAFEGSSPPLLIWRDARRGVSRVFIARIAVEAVPDEWLEELVLRVGMGEYQLHQNMVAVDLAGARRKLYG